LRLKEIKIFGFKSFPKKVKLSLDNGVTAFVGPNGCGKTNIVDAIRWALGEQRPTFLRCERMDELIFGGSEKKKPLGLAEVSLVFDNDGGFPIDFSEVSVTRRLFRSGESEYLINNAPCRWRDISELFLDTGLSAKAYALFEREMVDRVLSSESQFRRTFFEEASGTAKYRERRGLILKKLGANKEDFARLLDLLTEVERQERSLKRQAGKARRYVDLKKELDEKAVQEACQRYHAWKKEAETLEKNIGERKDEVKDVKGEVSGLEEKMGKRREVFKEKAWTRSQALTTLKTLREEIRELDREMALNIERKKLLTERRNRTLDEREEFRNRIPQIEKEIQGKQGNLSDLVSQRKILHEKQIHLEMTLEKEEEKANKNKSEEERFKRDYIALEVKMGGLKKALLFNQDKESNWKREEENVKNMLKEKESLLKETQKEVEELHLIKDGEEEKLEQVKKECDNILKTQFEIESRFAHLTREKHIMKETGELEEVLGNIREVIKIQPGYERAVEGALESHIRLLMVQNKTAGENVIEKLHDRGRFTIAPLEHFGTPRSEFRIPQFLTSLPNLLQYITCEDRYKPLLESLLGKFYLAPDLTRALEIRLSLENQTLKPTNGTHLVTQQGDVVEAQGLIRSGDFKSLNGDEGNQLREELEEIHMILPQKREEIQGYNQSLKRRMQKLEESLRTTYKLEEESENLKSRVKELETQWLECSGEIKKIQEEIKDSEERLREYQGSGPDSRELQISNTESERKALDEIRSEVMQSRMELVQKEGEIEKAQREYERGESALNETRSRLVKSDEEVGELEKVIRDLDAALETGEKRVEDTAEREKRLVVSLEEIGEPTLFEEMEVEEKGLKDKRKILDELQEEIHRLKLRWTEIETLRKNLKEQMEKDYQVDLEDVGQTFLPTGQAGLSVKDSEDAGGTGLSVAEDMIDPEEIERLKEKIRFLEPINMAAFEEHKEVKERLDFLTTQKVDLEEAKTNLEESLSTLDREARTRFMETFEQIREGFQNLFLRLFDGGQADLILNGGGDPLHSEIEIIANPKGKRFQRIEQLSAGERALTAIALLFSLYFIRPAPFCILDEIDAPLDDVNVFRFTQLVKEVSKRSQICLITHNKRTMEIADSLYGITMVEPGVSQIVSAKFNNGNE
jgi:chromosome segregation protein